MGLELRSWRSVVLFSVGVLVTAGVYGVVAIIVKADDFGVYLAQRGGTITTAIGQAITYGMPPFLKMSEFRLVAMLWVGGGIIIHGLHAYGIDGPEHAVQVISDAARATIPPIVGLLPWLAGAITSALSWGPFHRRHRGVCGCARTDTTLGAVRPAR